MSTLTQRDADQLDRANDSGRPTVLLIHGLWLLSSSWDRWRRTLEAAGYCTVAPGWPDDPPSIKEARASPDVFAKKTVGQVADHFSDACQRLTAKPAVIGHSFGGLVAQKVAGEGAACATVAIDAAPFRGVLPVPFSSLKSSLAVVGNPANAGRAVTLTFAEFKYGWANALPEAEAREIYDKDRGPMLLISGGEDHTIPPAVVRAEYKRQKRNAAVTEFVDIPNRGHSLIIDHGWQAVADVALVFLRTHLPVSAIT